jgi:hypothetical protein
MKKIFVILGIFPMRVLAQTNPIITDRPDQTESPFIVPVKHFQVETGFIFEQADTHEQSFVYPTILFKYGLTDNFELRVITNISNTKTEQEKIAGLNPVTVGFKVNILKERGIIPTTSFIGHLTIPALATEKLKATYYAPSFRFTMQHTLSKRFSLGYNFGAEFDGETAEPEFIYTLTTDYIITNKLSTYIELYGFAPQKSRADHRFDGGFAFLLQSNILIDLSAGFGITKNAPDYYVAIGFSFRLKD